MCVCRANLVDLLTVFCYRDEDIHICNFFRNSRVGHQRGEWQHIRWQAPLYTAQKLHEGDSHHRIIRDSFHPPSSGYFASDEFHTPLRARPAYFKRK